MIAESTFRQLGKIHVLEDVARGTQSINGVSVIETPGPRPPGPFTHPLTHLTH